MGRENLYNAVQKIRDYLNEVDTVIPTPWTITYKKPDIPPLERKYVLMYLLGKFGPLYRSQITDIAQVLYRDSLEQTSRPILSVCQEANLINEMAAKNNRIMKDRFMNHVALSYTPREMERDFSVQPLSEDNMECGLVDVLAGSRAPRPLLLELYSLEGLMILHTTKREGQEIFIPTHKAAAGSEALKVIFDHLNLKPKDLVQVSGFGTTIVSQTADWNFLASQGLALERK